MPPHGFNTGNQRRFEHVHRGSPARRAHRAPVRVVPVSAAGAAAFAVLALGLVVATHSSREKVGRRRLDPRSIPSDRRVCPL